MRRLYSGCRRHHGLAPQVTAKLGTPDFWGRYLVAAPCQASQSELPCRPFPTSHPAVPQPTLGPATPRQKTLEHPQPPSRC